MIKHPHHSFVQHKDSFTQNDSFIMRNNLITFILCTLIVASSCTSKNKINTASTTEVKEQVATSIAESIKEAPAPAQSTVIQQLKAAGNLYGDTQCFDKAALGYVVLYAPTEVPVFNERLHAAGMYTYFEKNKKDGVQTIYISKQPRLEFQTFIDTLQQKYPDFYKELSFIHDADSALIDVLKVDKEELQHGGIAYVFDKDGKELFSLDDYLCQGEKLQNIYQHFYPSDLKFTEAASKIETGKMVPPELNTYFADYLGKQNVLITFYPAPLSHSCSIQMGQLSEFAVDNLESKKLKVLAISIGNQEQVDAWGTHQPIDGIELVADSLGLISNAFDSILTEANGTIYSDRTVFLIDKTGIVRYINKDYDVGADLDILEEEIKKL